MPAARPRTWCDRHRRGAPVWCAREVGLGSWPVTVLLPVVLALIMFGLGLSLTLADFTGVVRYPRAVLVALGCHLVLLPVIASGLVVATGAAPATAVGVMLLMAAPGGATANLLSHLFHGDVALNVTLTAINSLLAVLTVPAVANLALTSSRRPGRSGSGCSQASCSRSSRWC